MAGWGGGNGGRVEEGRNFGSAFARLIFYLTNYKRKTRQKKTQPFILLIEKSNKKIF